MKKHANLIVLSCAAALVSGPAVANHCAADLAQVQQRLSQPTRATANALEAAAGLVQFAIDTCQYETIEIAASPPLTTLSASRATSRPAGDAGKREPTD